MKSMYGRQMAVIIGLISLCMAMLGAGFFSLSYQYHQNDIQKTIERNVTYISNYANATVTAGIALNAEHFQSYIKSVALITDATVILCRPDGRIIYAAGTNLSREAAANAACVPTWAVDELLSDQFYSGTTTFNELLSSRSFVTGELLSPYTIDPNTGETVSSKELAGLLFVASDATSVLDFMKNTFQLFFITAIAVLLISLVISSLTVQRMVDPLKVMCSTAHKFAHGEVGIRVTDYTDRQDEIGELAIAFNAMADSLAQAEQKRSEFVANVSHELKTPMTTIAGFAEGILDGTIPPEKEKESLQIISSETRRLSRLVRRMLELSRLQSSERVAAQEQFDVSEVLLQVLVSLEAKITEKNLEVETELPEGPVMVWGDPDAITQVCYNLLDNALKFSKEEGRLSLKIAQKGGKVLISIGNEGETIPPLQLAHIFDRFHKADSSRSAHKEGVGLGLYIVKTILNTYKEDITVTSENGFTEFTFTLSEV